MSIILIVLCGIIMGAVNFASFCLGYYVHSKKPASDGLTVTKDNAEFVNEMMKWRAYGGGK